MISQKRLKELLHYDPDSGLFTHKTNRGKANIGQLAGTVKKLGYICITLDEKKHLAHRLAWLYMTGEFPPAQLDHVNRIRSDNRLVNLRPATHSENMRNRGVYVNNTSGWCGVEFHRGKYQTKITLAGNHHPLGRYHSPEIAAAVYNHVVVQMHGEFARPDLPEWLIPDTNMVAAIGGNMKHISKALAAAAIHHAQQKESQNAE